MGRFRNLLLVGSIITGVIMAAGDKKIEIPTTGDEKYEYVMSLPEGIKVTHTPSKVHAVKGGRSGMNFTYSYATAVQSTVGPLTIVEFGAFGPYQGKWEFGTNTGKPFTPKRFEEWYSCPSAKLLPSETYTDPQNFTGAEKPFRGVTLWYFIGENPYGQKFRGTSLIETVSDLKNDT